MNAGDETLAERPGTAKGFVFLTLEDETGMSQAIVHPNLFREHRSLIVSSPGLIVEGILQNTDGQCSVKQKDSGRSKEWAISPVTIFTEPICEVLPANSS